MAKVTVSKRVDATIEEVWKSWDDFGNIYKFNPSVTHSKLLNNEKTPTRVGTKRQCDFTDGKNWVREEVIDYQPKKFMKIDVYDGTLPLKSMVATIEFEKIADTRTRVRFTADFQPKFGVAGLLMVPLMKRQFGKMLQSLLDDNAAHVVKAMQIPVAA